jgi:hypothetical protein
VAHQRGRAHIDLADLRGEPDSFQRQKEALFRLARRLKRVPTLVEALQFLKDERLFSGPWDENRDKRRARVKSILKFIARTFDAAKCAKGSVNVGKYDTWAARTFPNGLMGPGRRGLTEDGEVVEAGQGLHISPAFIGTFVAVCEFALLVDKNADGTLPHNRAQGIWQALDAKGLVPEPFCARKWAVCREELVRYGVVQITNRVYGPGKAMEWAVGRYFPGLDLWKSRKPASLLGPATLASRLRRGGAQATTSLNTWLRPQPCRPGVLHRWRLSRPPPAPVGAT